MRMNHERVIVPIEQEKRSAVDTVTAAYYLSRRPQTLRCWAFQKNGPLSPRNINGRLSWSVDEMRKLLGVVAV